MKYKVHLPRTMRDFLELYYANLLKAAESGCTLLTELQSALIDLLPLSKKLLPSNIDQLAGAEAQANFMTYIYYYSLFSFADKATMVNNGLSHKQLLTNCINAPLPDSTTIGKVVDDETLLRIY